MTLNVSDTLSLPLDVVTSSNAILGKKGSGKTSAAIVVFEEMFAAGVPVVSVDPKGDHYGIRSSADGKGPGLPVPVLGGQHGDVPLEPTAGAVVADLILNQRLSCVLDVSEFSRADVIRFLLPFAQRLYRQATAEPLHLLLEECHEYLPQVVRAEDAQMVGAWQRLVKMGRFKGIGVTLVSQRSAAVNKDVLEQVDNLIVLRTTGPRDRAAIEAWIDTHADRKDIMTSLPSLANGEAWLWQPERGEPVRFRFRMRHTYDAGATPEIGKARRQPSTLADIDLAAIKESMAETIERAKADDPKELRRRITQLERDLAAARAATPAPVVERIEVEVPVLDAATVAQFTGAVGKLAEAAADVGRISDVVTDALSDAEEAQRAGAGSGVPGAGTAGRGARAVASRAPERAPQRADPPVRRDAGRAAVPGAEEGAGRLGKGERTVLAVLAQFPAGRTYNELAFLAGYSAKASTLGNILARLRRAALVSPGGVDPIVITPEGLVEAGGAPAPLTGQALLDHWRSHPRMGEGERRVLDVLIERYPDALTHEELCEATGYSPSASTIGVILSKLRKLGLVGKGARRAADEFMDAIR